MITYTGMAVLAGIASLSWPIARPKIRAAVIATICAAFVWEARTFPVRWYLRATDDAAVYQWLNTIPKGGAILELPIRSMSYEYEYMLGTTIHHRPIVNGGSGFEPPDYLRCTALAHETPIPERLLDELERVHVNLVIVHADRLAEREDATVDFIRRGVASGRLRFIGRFTHDHRGDFVFAIPPRTRRPDDADSILARLIQEPVSALKVLSARRFMETQNVVGMLDYPYPGLQIHGPLDVRGWGLSPHGVRDVHVLLNSGRLRYRAELGRRLDLASVYPNLRSHAGQAGFHLAFREKPRNVWQQSDLQIEITDHAGRKHRLPQIWFQWSDA
jgi:hypothetical protein